MRMITDNPVVALISQDGIPFSKAHNLLFITVVLSCQKNVMLYSSSQFKETWKYFHQVFIIIIIIIIISLCALKSEVQLMGTFTVFCDSVIILGSHFNGASAICQALN